MSREPIAPDDCPEPFWHETHRYCPVCTWQEPQEEAPPSVLDRALALLDRWQDGYSPAPDIEFPLLDETRALLTEARQGGTDE